MGVDFIDPEQLGNMASTLPSVFPHVQIYRPIGGSFFLLARISHCVPSRKAGCK